MVADQWAGLGAYLSTTSPSSDRVATTAAPATSSWALGDVLVDLFGEIHADEVLIDGFAGLSGGQVEAALAQALGFASGFDGVAATGSGARRAPASGSARSPGTLTINLGIAATGGNTAQTSTVNVVVVDQEANAASDAQVSDALGQGVRAAVEAVRRRDRRPATPPSIPPTWRCSSTPPRAPRSSSPATPPPATPR